MASISYRRRTRWRDVPRRVAKVMTAATAILTLLIATLLIAAKPAAAETPWLTVSDDGYASFAVPADYVESNIGAVSQLVVEGNLGPSSSWAELGLTRRGSAWTAVTGPLEAGSYYYQFTGDDAKVLKDPTNPTSVTAKPTWSTFFVPGDSARMLADVPAGRGGIVETLTYRSGVVSAERSATVWTPPGYDADRAKPYPVLYLLNGEGGSHADWVELGRAKQILDNLSIRGRIEPMVVVMGDGNVADFRKELRTIVQAARRGYNISHEPRRQALAGPSTGGSQALQAVLARPGEFAYVGSFAGLLSDSVGSVDARAVNRGTKLLRLYTGNVTDPAYNPTYRLMRAFGKARISYEFDGVNPDVGHTWRAWQEDLVDFAPRLFRGVSDHDPSPGHLRLEREFTLPPKGTTPTPWLSRQANGDTFATFETTTAFANAQHVTVWGNWAPGGSWLRMPASRHGDRWRVTVGPLKPWFYYHKLIVDRVSVKDASNPTSVTTEPTWSTFLVPGRSARLVTDVPAGRGGAVDRLTYNSSVAGQERTAYVWTPPGYDPDREKPYPVFYLQHGGGQNYTDWVEMGRAKQILDNESLDGDLEPMVVVMGNGNVSNFTAELLDNIVPAARARYHISDDPAQQALAGLSMGGAQTYQVLRSHPGEFAYIGTFSAAGFGNTSGVDVAAINDGTRLLRVYTGDVTDFVYPSVLATMATFDDIGIEYEFAGVTQGPHGWDVWQKNLIDFAPRLFKQDNS
jgi:enterochelin esterase-like enzyme